MKLLVPVVGIVFSIGACCCGDMGGLEERIAKKLADKPAATGSIPTGE